MELKEEIAKKLHVDCLANCNSKDYGLGCWQPCKYQLESSGSIVALIDQHFPELAKERGYELVKDIATAEQFQAFMKSQGWVKLAKDQTLPPIPDTSKPPFKCDTCGASHFDLWSYRVGTSALLEAGYRKIEDAFLDK